jgi:hypothetical protein
VAFERQAHATALKLAGIRVISKTFPRPGSRVLVALRRLVGSRFDGCTVKQHVRNYMYSFTLFTSVTCSNPSCRLVLRLVIVV